MESCWIKRVIYRKNMEEKLKKNLDTILAKYEIDVFCEEVGFDYHYLLKELITNIKKIMENEI